MNVVVGCDGRETSSYLETLGGLLPVAVDTVFFIHVSDDSIVRDWESNAGHRWLGRRPAPRELDTFHVASETVAHETLERAMTAAASWSVAGREAIRLSGNPERELVRFALEEHADLLAVGQHRVGLGPHALGHCARFVVDHAPCPVLVVRGYELRAAAPRLLAGKLQR